MSLPSTPSRLSTRQRNKVTPISCGPDVAKLSGDYDTNSVRERIRQWQAQGGGVVDAEDVGPDDDVDVLTRGSKTQRRQKERSPHTPSERAEKKQDTIIIKGDSINHEGRKRDLRENRRPGIAPAKRVVSDGHWRKKRSPPKSATSVRTGRDTSPSRAHIKDSMKTKPASEPRLRRRDRSERVKKSPETHNTTSAKATVNQSYITPNSAKKQAEQSQRRRSASLEQSIPDKHNTRLDNAAFNRNQELQGDSSNPDMCLLTDPPMERERARCYRHSLQPSEDKAISLKRTTKGRGSIQSDKGNILSQVFGDSRKLFAKQAPEPAITPRIPSIEAWLENTSDPFVDEEGPPIEAIAPLQISRTKQPHAEQESVTEDPNRMWDKSDMKGGTRRAISSNTKKRRIPSSAIYHDNPFSVDFDPNPDLSGGTESENTPKFVDLTSRQAESSPPSLKRRAARKIVSSPVRDRQKEGSIKISSGADDIISNHSSQVTLSSVEGPDPSNPFKPPGLNVKRPFPSTGQHRLSTIASVETFNTRMRDTIVPSVSAGAKITTQSDPIKEDSLQGKDRDKFDPDSLKINNSHLTKHADLISVLSLPRAGGKSVKSARSIRTNRTRLESATVDDLMQELATDECKYMRELLTLVDGVIPVLLSCVLSKSDSAAAAGLFQPSAAAKEDPSFTRPIIDMGISLERLKTLHKRIPQKDLNSFLTWAHGAQRVYTEYLKAWRLGFQDVVVNLAPAVGDSPNFNGANVDEGLPRNENGDVVNGDGERVDVAFLLKRPLVRLKYLSKTMRGISIVKPSEEAANLARTYQELVEAARLRANEERARLEDESAANIDTTRCRDPRTLAPISGVIVDRLRRVRARDYFNLALQHSNGQCVDCRIELVFRDEAGDTAKGGDLLICEVDGLGRWLLFPPIKSDLVSARNGDRKGEIAIMIRGFRSDGSQWYEVLTLGNEEEQVGFEWVQMLGLHPVPPTIARARSFVGKQCTKRHATEQLPSDHLTSDAPASPTKSRTPSPREVDVPIGEQAGEESKVWSDSPTSSDTLLPANDVGHKDADEHSKPTPSRVSTSYIDKVNDLRSLPSQHRAKDTKQPDHMSRAPRSFKEALGLSGYSTMSGLKRTKAKRISRNTDNSPVSPRSRSSKHDSDSRTSSPGHIEAEAQSGYNSASFSQGDTLSSEPTEKHCMDHSSTSVDLEVSKVTSIRLSPSVLMPSMKLPYIPKVRRASLVLTPTIAPPEEPIWSTPAKSAAALPPVRLSKNRHSPHQNGVEGDNSRPSTPIHKHSDRGGLDLSKTPPVEPTRIRHRRSSSPLKHEYEPSTESESSSNSDASTVERHDLESMTETSDEEDLEDGDVPTPLMPLGIVKRTPKLPGRPSSLPISEGTLKPSDSASQAPYKAVPTQPKKAARTIALIFSWSDAGSWQSLHPDECSIVITPGLIEAYEMSAAHSDSKPISTSVPIIDANKFADDASTVMSQDNEDKSERPLVALELTPLVPLRRGTAIDISIRSPPTASSQITSGNNIMFRSRNPEECEALYALINHSRIHNPTYIALQNARGPFASGSCFPGAVGRRPSSRASNTRSSWFGGFGRSPSYRASSARTPSIAPSESSVGSMSSAFSALKRFGRTGGGGMFNISLSTITSRSGAGSGVGSVYTSSDNSSGSGVASPIAPGMVANRDGSLGLKDAKIRLYIRETASRWRDMGSARLTILPPERVTLGPDGRTLTTGEHPHGIHEKRILVNGKTKGEILLDAQLGESCFERVARTGIAVSVWEDVVGPNGEVGVVGAVGGVAGGRAKVYMIQMKSEAETAYTFSLVGKLRY